MNNEYPKHFSYNYEINLDKVPARKTDRVSLCILLPGIFLGTLLVALGVYELLDGFFISSKTAFDNLHKVTTQRALLNPIVFDVIIITIGLGIIISLISSYIKYKKIFFDGSTFIITNRPLFSAKKIVSEDLTNYEGVRVRTEFVQFGLLNRTRYIIELAHHDENKTVPLYISLKKKNINPLIKSYAEKLVKPIIVSRGGDFVFRTIDEYFLSIADMKDDLDGYSLDMEAYKPKMLISIEKDNKVILKVKRAIFDAYNLLAILIIALMVSVVFALFCRSHEVKITLFVVLGYILAFFGGGAAVMLLFKRDKIIIKTDKVIVHHKFFGFSRKRCEMKKKDIKSVEVTTNPATGRSFLTVSSDDKDMIFGKKLPMDDLIWTRAFLIKEIMK